MAVRNEKLLSSLFPIGGGAVVTNDWYISLGSHSIIPFHLLVNLIFSRVLMEEQFIVYYLSCHKTLYFTVLEFPGIPHPRM